MSIDRERIRRMSAAGYTNREIARELGCSHTRVAQVIAEDGRLEVTATVRATKSQVIIDTSDAQVTGVAVRRALERAGILLSDAGQSSGPPPRASNRNKEG
jgi:predicted transcriptional regulator